MIPKDKRPVLVGALLLAALGAYVAARFEVTNDIGEFLPDAGDRELSSLSRQIAESELSRTMVLVLNGDAAIVPEASRAFEAALRAEPRVADGLAFLEGGPAEGVERALWELYEPRRLSFLAEDAAGARARLTDEALTEAAAHLKEELGGPMSLLTARVAPRDPLLVLPSLFRRLERSRGSDLTIADGRFVTSDGRGAVLFLGTRATAFDAAAQAPLLEGVQKAFAKVDARYGGRLTLDQSGLNRFATRAATAIEGDIQRVSVLSVVLLGALLLVLFRSVRVVALASIPVGAGVLAGAATALFFFGRLHGITVAFGASLLGVSIDYVIHLYCHHVALGREKSVRATVAMLVRPLATGAATTLVGFLALLASSLAGLREVACFASAGIVAASVTTLVMIPPLLPADPRPSRPFEALLSWLGRALAVLRRHRRVLWILPAIVVVFVAALAPRVRFNDDFASLGKLDPELLAEDARVRERVTRFEQMRFVVALGDSEDAALAANERVARHLGAATGAGELAAFRSLAALLPSATTQAAVADAALSDPTLASRVGSIFGAAGFAPGAFAPFDESLRGPRPAPLRYEDLMGSPLASLARPFRVELGDRVGFVTFLHGVADADALGARLAGDPEIVFLRQADLFGQAHRAYQERAVKHLALGVLGVLLLLALRYRDLRRTAAAFLPPVLAVGATIAALALTGRGLDLVTLTAMLFVIAMGEDYSVFLIDAGDEPGSLHLETSLASVLLACVTTLIGFGLLALSEHPVLSSLGITATVGILASFLLAPTTLYLLAPEPASAEPAPEAAP